MFPFGLRAPMTTRQMGKLRAFYLAQQLKICEQTLKPATWSRSWVDYCKFSQWRYNFGMASATGLAPITALTGLQPNSINWKDLSLGKMAAVRMGAIKKLMKKLAAAARKRAQEWIKAGRKFSLHNWVFMVSPGGALKLTPVSGPFWVSQIVNDGAFLLWDPVEKRSFKASTRRLVLATPSEDIMMESESFKSGGGVVATSTSQTET